MEPTNTVMNGELSRWKAYWGMVKDVWNTVGLPTILLGVVIGLWAGWIPSPVIEARNS